jgi:hypothetical protein
MPEVTPIQPAGAVESRSIVAASGHGLDAGEATMMCDGGGSVTRWVGGIKAGDPEAARRLWERYFAELVRLARARLRDAPRAAADEEDAALSAFDSLCRGAEQGRFPHLDDRADLWRVLVTITARKAADLRRSRPAGLHKPRPTSPAPSWPRWWPTNAGGSSMPSPTRRCGRSHSSGWRGIPTGRSPPSWTVA